MLYKVSKECYRSTYFSDFMNLRVHGPSHEDIQSMSKTRRNYTELFGYLSTARPSVVLALGTARGGHARRIPEVGGRQGAS